MEIGCLFVPSAIVKKIALLNPVNHWNKVELK